MSKTEKDTIFELIQKFISNPPLVVWGSGATISYGMPSMSALNTEVGKVVPEYDTKANNIEVELGNDKYIQYMPKIRSAIWDIMAKRDEQALALMVREPECYEAIKTLIEKILVPHPQRATIVTTNYDRVLERVMALNDIPFTDGFSGHDFSVYKEECLRVHRKGVLLLKVHGSLAWFKVGNSILHSERKINDEVVIIPPGKNKYREVWQEPYRDLVRYSDEAIDNAKCFLVVGFGFNDEHLTPKISNAVANGLPIVIVTKTITDTTRIEMARAQNCIFVEELNTDNTKTKFSIIKGNSSKEIILDGAYWKLGEFLTII